jgi:hypothetical protein
MFMACQMDVVHAFYNSSQAEHDEEFTNDIFPSFKVEGFKMFPLRLKSNNLRFL